MSISTRFQKLCVIGRGSYGTVYLAKNDIGKYVVLKEITLAPDTHQPNGEAKETTATAAVRETQLLQSLSHPNVIKVFGAFASAHGGVNIVMELVRGGDLAQRIAHRLGLKNDYLQNHHKKDTPLTNDILLRFHFSERRVVHWSTGICLALSYLHAKHVIHRDIKTANVLLTSDHEVKLGDFGVARKLDRTLDVATTQCGTPFYLSPEVCKNEGYDQKSDVWALGVVIYELVTLTRPFHADNILTLVRKIVMEPHVSLQELLPGLYSEELSQLIDLMLSKNPKHRPDVHQCLSVLRRLEGRASWSSIESVDHDPLWEKVNAQFLPFLNLLDEKEILSDNTTISSITNTNDNNNVPGTTKPGSSQQSAQQQQAQPVSSTTNTTTNTTNTNKVESNTNSTPTTTTTTTSTNTNTNTNTKEVTEQSKQTSAPSTTTTTTTNTPLSPRQSLKASAIEQTLSAPLPSHTSTTTTPTHATTPAIHAANEDFAESSLSFDDVNTQIQTILEHHGKASTPQHPHHPNTSPSPSSPSSAITPNMPSRTNTVITTTSTTNISSESHPYPQLPSHHHHHHNHAHGSHPSSEIALDSTLFPNQDISVSDIQHIHNSRFTDVLNTQQDHGVGMEEGEDTITPLVVHSPDTQYTTLNNNNNNTNNNGNTGTSHPARSLSLRSQQPTTLRVPSPDSSDTSISSVKYTTSPNNLQHYHHSNYTHGGNGSGGGMGGVGGANGSTNIQPPHSQPSSARYSRIRSGGSYTRRPATDCDSNGQPDNTNNTNTHNTNVVHGGGSNTNNGSGGGSEFTSPTPTPSVILSPVPPSGYRPLHIHRRSVSSQRPPGSSQSISRPTSSAGREACSNNNNNSTNNNGGGYSQQQQQQPHQPQQHASYPPHTSSSSYGGGGGGGTTVHGYGTISTHTPSPVSPHSSQQPLTTPTRGNSSQFNYHPTTHAHAHQYQQYPPQQQQQQQQQFSNGYNNTYQEVPMQGQMQGMDGGNTSMYYQQHPHHHQHQQHAHHHQQQYNNNVHYTGGHNTSTNGTTIITTLPPITHPAEGEATLTAHTRGQLTGRSLPRTPSSATGRRYVGSPRHPGTPSSSGLSRPPSGGFTDSIYNSTSSTTNTHPNSSNNITNTPSRPPSNMSSSAMGGGVGGGYANMDTTTTTTATTTNTAGLSREEILRRKKLQEAKRREQELNVALRTTSQNSKQEQMMNKQRNKDSSGLLFSSVFVDIQPPYEDMSSTAQGNTNGGANGYMQHPQHQYHQHHPQHHPHHHPQQQQQQHGHPGYHQPHPHAQQPQYHTSSSHSTYRVGTAGSNQGGGSTSIGGCIGGGNGSNTTTSSGGLRPICTNTTPSGTTITTSATGVTPNTTIATTAPSTATNTTNDDRHGMMMYTSNGISSGPATTATLYSSTPPTLQPQSSLPSQPSSYQPQPSTPSSNTSMNSGIHSWSGTRTRGYSHVPVIGVGPGTPSANGSRSRPASGHQLYTHRGGTSTSANPMNMDGLGSGRNLYITE